MAKNQNDQPVADRKEPEFTKAQLMASKTLDLPGDAVAAVLEEGKIYTKDRARNLVLQFLQGKV